MGVRGVVLLGAGRVSRYVSWMFFVVRGLSGDQVFFEVVLLELR